MERLVCLAALLSVAFAASGSFNYTHQDTWGGTCNTGGRRQSPIDIATSSTVDNDELLDLMLSLWNEQRDGVFYNTGTGVKFAPNAGQSVATTTNHLGVYEVLQFHVHWGATDKVGSEHLVDSTPASAEIHFVHGKRGDASGGTAGEAFAVVGVMAVANDSAISGVWSDLNVEEVQGSGGEFNTTVRYSDLLPSDLSYYQYPGSLTTPDCSEVVQWFLLSETVSVPRAYLEQLREVEQNEKGEPLTTNYRDTQDLAGRQVALHTESGGARLSPVLSITLLSVLLLVFVLL